jgi:hypothetical protein
MIHVNNIEILYNYCSIGCYVSYYHTKFELQAQLVCGEKKIIVIGSKLGINLNCLMSKSSQRFFLGVQWI